MRRPEVGGSNLQYPFRKWGLRSLCWDRNLKCPLGNERTVLNERPTENSADIPASLPEVNLADLPENVQHAAARAGWATLMPVQSKAIPYVLAHRDALVQARTGSGKTGAFVLPLLGVLDPAKPVCQALILVPTRELAQQVYREAQLLLGDAGILSVPVYGGVSYKPQIEAFEKGAHVVVGTPGRILDHLISRKLQTRDLRVLIFDEADRLMSMGFYPDMREIHSYLPSRRSSFMFSATFPTSVRGLAREFLHEPESVSLSEDAVHVTGMDHVYYEVPAMDKDRALVRIIEMENPSSAMIFCNTKDRTAYVATVLQRFGYDADMLTADLSQSARDLVMERLRESRLRFLVATDVAARGLDISDLSHVFLYEFPEDPESYIHRAGRTARAGASGVAISLVTFQELVDLGRVARRFGIEMEKRELPTDLDVQELVAQRVTALLEAKLRSRDKLHLERMKRLVPLARSLADSEDELDLIAMLLDDYYQASLHAPPSVPLATTGAGGRSAAKPEGQRPRRRRRR